MISVVLTKGTDYASFEALLQQHGYSYSIKFKRIFFIESELESFQFKTHTLVESCESTQPLKLEHAAIDRVDNDVNVAYLTGLQNSKKPWGPHRIVRKKNPFNRRIGAIQTDYDLIYKSQRTGVGVDIYLIDLATSTYHQELDGRMTLIGSNRVGAPPIGSTEFDTTALFEGEHGLYTTACAAGTHTGIAQGSDIFFYDLFPLAGEEEFLTPLDVVHTHYLARAGTNRPALLNLSWAAKGTTPSAAVTAAFDDMIEDGIVVTVAANNDRWDLDVDFVYPAESHPSIVVVGATDAFDFPMWLSRGDKGTRGTGVGSGVDIYAPGTNLAVASAGTPTDYKILPGTSFAAPYAMGVMACMLEGYPRLTSKVQVDAVVQKLIDNSTKDVLKFGNGYYASSVINNRLLYLDPFVSIESIDGLTPL